MGKELVKYLGRWGLPSFPPSRPPSLPLSLWPYPLSFHTKPEPVPAGTSITFIEKASRCSTKVLMLATLGVASWKIPIRDVSPMVNSYGKREASR